MLRRLWLLLLLLAAAPAWADDLAGLYDAQGQYPNGKAYQGVVQILPYGSAQAILWKLNDGGKYEGLALRQGDVLGAAYAPLSKMGFGLVVYRINGGTLDGAWLTSGNAKGPLGRETLQGPESLSGQYQITLGENGDGNTNYTGQVLIKPDGNTFVFAWLVPKLAYVGRGIRIGNVMVVAYSRDPKQLPGVVAYQVQDQGTLKGVWSPGAAPQVGTETLTRHPQ
ncbi:MAG TPA: hypothetical protein VMT54_00255 [Candidatus Cybelea sp.]|nr:hypothetical protein [Candidatus Cybelea sp.]